MARLSISLLALTVSIVSIALDLSGIGADAAPANPLSLNELNLPELGKLPDESGTPTDGSSQSLNDDDLSNLAGLGRVKWDKVHHLAQDINSEDLPGANDKYPDESHGPTDGSLQSLSDDDLSILAELGRVEWEKFHHLAQDINSEESPTGDSGPDDFVTDGSDLLLRSPLDGINPLDLPGANDKYPDESHGPTDGSLQSLSDDDLSNLADLGRMEWENFHHLVQDINSEDSPTGDSGPDDSVTDGLDLLINPLDLPGANDKFPDESHGPTDGSLQSLSDDDLSNLTDLGRVGWENFRHLAKYISSDDSPTGDSGPDDSAIENPTGDSILDEFPTDGSDLLLQSSMNDLNPSD